MYYWPSWSGPVVGRRPMNQEVPRFDSQWSGHMLGLWLDPQEGPAGGSRSMFLSHQYVTVSLPLSLPLKSIKTF